MTDPLLAINVLWPPTAGPEASVKLQAADFLLQQPSYSSKSVLVASHVTTRLAGGRKLSTFGVLKGFEQFLSEDPCFEVDKSKANAIITLNTSQVLSQLSWRQEEQAAQQHMQPQQHFYDSHTQPTQVNTQPQQPQAAAAGSSSTGGVIRLTPRLLQKLEEVWPLDGNSATAESNIKHVTLLHLAHEQGYSLDNARLAAAVRDALGGSPRQLGSTQTHRQIWRQNPDIFVLEQGLDPNNCTVRLNVSGVLNMFVRRPVHSGVTEPQQQQQQQQQLAPLRPPGLQRQQQPPGSAMQQLLQRRLQLQQQQQEQPGLLQQQQQEQQPPSSAMQRLIQAKLQSQQQQQRAAESGTVSAAALLQYVRSRVWHSNALLHSVRLALAERLVLKVNGQAAANGDQQPANSDPKWYIMLASMTGPIIAHALQGFGPEAATLTPTLEEIVDQDPYLSLQVVGDVQHIKMDVQQLLQDAAAAAAAPAASAPAAPAPAAPAPAAPVPAPAAAHEGQQVSVAGLMAYVSRRVWHDSSEMLDFAKRTLAGHIVRLANPTDDMPMKLDMAAYTESSVNAGHLINKALRARYGNLSTPPYKKFAELFTGDPCWLVVPPQQKSGHRHVQLKVHRLLQEAAQAQAGEPTTANGFAASGTVSNSRAGPSSSSSSTSGTLQQVSAVRTAAAACASSSGLGAAEAAAAAIKAAATSLMPPPVVPIAMPRVAEAGLSLAAAGTTGVQEPVRQANGVVGATAEAAGAASLSPPSAAAAAAVQPKLFFPPWLQLNRASTAPVAQQQPAVPVTNSGSVPNEPTARQEQQQNLTSNADDAATAAAAAAAAESVSHSGRVVPLKYKLVLSNASPGWWTADYQAWQDTADNNSSSSSGGGSTTGHVNCSASQVQASHSVSAAAALETNTLTETEVSAVEGPGTPELLVKSLVQPVIQAVVAQHVATDDPATSVSPGDSSSTAGDICTADSSGTAGDTSRTDGSSGAANSALPAAAAAAAGQEQPVSEALDVSQDMQQLLQAVPKRLHEELLGYVTRGPDEPAVTHILIRTRQPVTLRFTNKTAVALKSSVSLHDTLTHFAAVQQAWAAQQQADAEGCRDPTAARDQQQEGSSSSSSTDFGVDGIEFEPKAQGKGVLTADTLANSGLNAADKGTKSSAGIHKADVTAAAAAAALSANASFTALRAAALQLFGSSTGCFGIPGTCHRACAVPAAAGGIAGVTYCLEQYTPGAADSLADVLSSMKASLLPGARVDWPASLLVLGRPGSCQSSFLRDVCRLMSSSPDQGGLGLNVMLMDTTGALAGLADPPTPRISDAQCIPVPNRSQQSSLLLQVAQHHQPDVLVVGELSTQQEVAAAVRISRSCNVLLVAAAPASDLGVVLQDSELCQLLGYNRVGPGGTVAHRLRLCPFSLAVELQGHNRFCLHDDLQRNVDLLATHLCTASSSSSSSRGLTQPSLDPPSLQTQLRSKGTDGSLVVKFSSADAACRVMQRGEQLALMLLREAEESEDCDS